jgi:hypothetical protein
VAAIKPIKIVGITNILELKRTPRLSAKAMRLNPVLDFEYWYGPIDKLKSITTSSFRGS